MSNEASGAPTKVLVIDDSNTIRRSAEIFLRQGGYEVVLAEDGFDALAKVNDHDPQLIWIRPILGGYAPADPSSEHDYLFHLNTARRRSLHIA